MTPLQAVEKHREVAAALLVAAGVSWWWTAGRMAGMDAGPGTALGTLGWFTGSWVAMMAAMMLPSFVPTLAGYLTATRGREPGRWLFFAGGYLLVWAAAGLAVYGIFELGKDLLASELAWHRAGRWLSAGVLAVAALYEFVPLKQSCLTRCRGQLGSLHRWSSHSWPAALSMGARSGGWCLGCSWALMAALFALGVMSLTWMALIAGLVALEKVGPWPAASRLATATVLAALAVGIIAAPQDVPGLVVPGSGGMHAMKAMMG
jgi:predicted metal-binding membrane protein